MKYRKIALLFHGFPEKVSPITPLYRYLSENGYRIVMPDLFSNDCSLQQSALYATVGKLLEGKSPDVIIGISMGGLIAPHFAKTYPRAKLVCIGTGPYLKTTIPIYNFLISMESRDTFLILVRFARIVPKWLFRLIYMAVNKRTENSTDMDIRTRADANWQTFSVLPLRKTQEILRFAVNSDTTGLLKTLSNTTLIFAGSQDAMMPLSHSETLHRLVSNSTLIVSDRPHYAVFTEKEFHYLDEFLS